LQLFDKVQDNFIWHLPKPAEFSFFAAYADCHGPPSRSRIIAAGGPRQWRSAASVVSTMAHAPGYRHINGRP
jgi:hypothetical protein